MNSKLAIYLGLLAMAAMANQVVEADNSLEDLCNDRPILLESISKARKLIEENEREPLKACDKFKGSLKELDHILALVQSGDICNLEFVGEIRKYHMKFIYKSEESESNQTEGIPNSLRLFFMKLSFKVSAQCKKTLINDLEYDTKGIINDEDYEQIELLERHGALLMDKETEITDFDDIILFEEFDMALEDNSEVEETQMSVLVQTSAVLRQLTFVCKQKFRPFYQRLIMPLIKLSHLGYNYQGELLKREIEELKRNQFIRRWYNIVQLCESMRMIRVYQNPVSTGESNGVLTFIGREQEAKMRALNMKSIDEEETGGGETIKPPERDQSLEDVLWTKDDGDLNELIQKFQASASEADRVRGKMVRKVLNKMKALLTSGKVFMFASELIACTRNDRCEADKQSVNFDMIRLIDEVVEDDAIEKGEIEESSERAVAWFNGGSGAPWIGGARDRGISTKKGNKSRRVSQNPPRPPPRRKVKNYTSYAKRFKLSLGRWRPSKLSVTSWLMGIFGFLVIMLCIMATG